MPRLRCRGLESLEARRELWRHAREGGHGRDQKRRRTLRSDSRAGTNSAAAAPKSAAWLRSKRRHRRRAQAASAAATMKKGMLSGSATSTARHSATPYNPGAGRACAAPRPRSSPRAVSGTPPPRRRRARKQRTSTAIAPHRRGRRGLLQCDHAQHDAAVQVRPRDEEHRHEAPALARHQDEQGREQRKADHLRPDGPELRRRNQRQENQRTAPEGWAVMTRQTRTQARSAIEAAKAASAGIPPARHSP